MEQTEIEAGQPCPFGEGHVCNGNDCKPYPCAFLKNAKPVRVSDAEQPYAACDHCDSQNNLDRYQYKGTTWCEACLEQVMEKEA